MTATRVGTTLVSRRARTRSISSFLPPPSKRLLRRDTGEVAR